MSEEFLEENVVHPASDLFTWGQVSEAERLSKLLLAYPDANQSERIELQRYNELFQLYYAHEGRSYIFDIAVRHGGVIPIVMLERIKAGIPYTLPVTRRVLIMTPNTSVDVSNIAGHIRDNTLRFQMLTAGTVVHLMSLTFWREAYDHALVPYSMYPISHSPRTYILDRLDLKRPLWLLPLHNGPQRISSIYEHYLNGIYRDGLYDPVLGYTRGLWTPENLIDRRLAAREKIPEDNASCKVKYPESLAPRAIVNLPAYVDRKQAYHRKLYETLRDNMENGITHWATKVIHDIMPGRADVGPQIEELAREAREIIDVYRHQSCPHFHIRGRFDASFKAETRHQTFLIMERLGTEKYDFRRQYHCTECGLALYCQHEELQQRKYKNPLHDINIEPFYEIHEDVISCQFCRRFIGIKESEVNIEFDENDRRIVGKAVETDGDVRIRDLITRVAATLRIGAALSYKGQVRVKDEVLAAHWLETLRPVIQTIYQEARDRSAKKYSIGVYNLLIILGYIVYSILVERTLPASIVMGPGKGTPNMETLIRATIDCSSKSLFVHNILLQIPSVSKREHFLKVIIEKYIWKILEEGAVLMSQAKDTIAMQRFFLAGIGGPTYTAFVRDNVDPSDRISSEPGKVSSRRIPRLYEFIHRKAVIPVEVPWKVRIYGSMCYGDDGHWHDWDAGPRSMGTPCSVCKMTIQQAYDVLLTGDVSRLEEAALNAREQQQAAIACPNGGFHQIDLDVCLRCGQTLDEMAKPGKKRKASVPVNNRRKVQSRKKVAQDTGKLNKGDLENLIAEYSRLLAQMAPTMVDPFKDAIGSIKASSQFNGGLIDEYRVRMGSRAKISHDIHYETSHEVAAAILRDCVANLKGSSNRELAMEQVAFWKAARGTVIAREYDEKFFLDRELDLEREQHERLMEFLSKTMDQKIADALLGDEIHDIEPATEAQDEEPQDDEETPESE